MQQASTANSKPNRPGAADPYLHSVESTLADCLRARDNQTCVQRVDLQQAGQHVCLAAGAKRIRPVLVKRFAQLLQIDLQQTVSAAAAAELMHAASLLHDDVIDEGTVRRGKAAANVLWGNRTAVLAGDYLLCLALQLLDVYPRQVMQQAIAVVARMTHATAMELNACGYLHGDFAIWHEIAAGKTGALFAWCSALSGWLLQEKQGREEKSDTCVSHRLSQCGYALGTAFQMADDLLDLQHSSDLNAKTPFADIRNRQPSYPLLWAAKRCPAVHQALQQLWRCDVISHDDSAHVGKLVLQTGALQHTQQELCMHVQQAIDGLGELTKSPQGESLVQWLRSFLPNSRLP